MRHFALITGLLALACLVHCQCPINRRQVEGSNGAFVYQNAQGALQLLRTPAVPEGATFQMLCPAPEAARQSTCRNRRFNPQLPLTCQNPMVPVVVQVTDSSCPATMYAIGYRIGNSLLELYRACYDRVNVRAHFTEGLIYPKSFFPQRPNTQFSTDGVITPQQEASFLKRNIFRAFQRIYGTNQRYLPNNRDTIINRGHLLASSDFLFGDQSAGTFKYVNVVPQFKSINDGNWESIERWVRGQIPVGSALRIKTGGQGVLSLAQANPPRTLRPAYLANGNQNPVPEWVYKLVKTANNQPLYAFVSYNNIFAPQRPPAPAFCQSVACPNTLTLGNSAAEGYIYCCDPAQFRI